MASPADGDLVAVDADGDLILKVGNENLTGNDDSKAEDNANNQPQSAQNQVKDNSARLLLIRVSSKFMTMCSPVFKAMLDGPFSEGQLPLSVTNPPTLRLPEDNPDSMLKVCRIFHHQWDMELADFLSSNCMIAAVADKYACTSVIMTWFHHHLLRHSPTWQPQLDRDLANLITTAYLLNDVEAFYSLTLTGIQALWWKENENKVFVKGFNDWIPGRVIELMEKSSKFQEKELLVECQRMLSVVFEEEISASDSIWSYPNNEDVGDICTGQAQRVGRFVHALCVFGLWPGSDPVRRPANLNHAIKLIRAVGSEVVNDTRSHCGATGCESCGMLWGLVAEEKLKDFENAVHGLCLTCLKTRPEAYHTEFSRQCKLHNNGFAVTSWLRLRE